jgi:hypothetical protein
MQSPSSSSFRVVNLLGSLSACALALIVGCSSQAPPENGGARDASPQILQVDAQFVGGCRVGLPLQSAPCFTCEPLPADSHNVGCSGPLPSLWGFDGGTSASAPVISYPLECMVYLPVENPYYPGGPQFCSCMQFNDTTTPQWLCPI